MTSRLIKSASEIFTLWADRTLNTTDILQWYRAKCIVCNNIATCKFCNDVTKCNVCNHAATYNVRSLATLNELKEKYILISRGYDQRLNLCFFSFLSLCYKVTVRLNTQCNTIGLLVLEGALIQFIWLNGCGYSLPCVVFPSRPPIKCIHCLPPCA